MAVARRINKQDDYTKYMLSIIAIVMWLFSKVSTYPELGQIQNWQKTKQNKTKKKKKKKNVDPEDRFSRDAVQMTVEKDIACCE